MHRAHEWALDLMGQAFDRPAWHGPNMRTAFRGLTAEAAAWKPAPNRHSPWEIVLHCAYWKHRVHRRVAPDSAMPVPRTGHDWLDLPVERTARNWKSDLGLLTDVHEALREAVMRLQPADLAQPGPRQKRPRLEHLVGIACHDLYHAGKVRLLCRLGEKWSATISRRRANNTVEPSLSTRQTVRMLASRVGTEIATWAADNERNKFDRWNAVVYLPGPHVPAPPCRLACALGPLGERTMEIGYWIKDGLIYGPQGYTGFRIENKQIFGRAGYTRLWIHRDQIYSSTAGNTGFWIDNNRIHGPGRELPWLPQTTTQAPGTRHIQI